MEVSFQPGEEMTEQCPALGFEGFEKRLEVEFCPFASLTAPDERGLRALSRVQLDQLLQAAQCTIVSQLSNSFFDSYVLSESSLFIYPHKIILKTCGTTKLLEAVPLLLDFASSLFLKVKRCKYTRGAFLFPSEQPYPHRSFNEEVSYLEKYFGRLGSSKACTMGDGEENIMGKKSRIHNWHIYSAIATDNGAPSSDEPVYTLEMCMTQLDGTATSTFFKTACETATQMTRTSGIAELLPSSQICDFAFDPCGYSMNGIEGSALSTIHVTPEEGFSYSSFETMGYDPSDVNLETLVNKVLSCFRPVLVSVSVHATCAPVSNSLAVSWGKSFCPRGYVCCGSSSEELPGGSLMVFHTFRESRSLISPVSPLPLFPLRRTLPPKLCSLRNSLEAKRTIRRDIFNNVVSAWELSPQRIDNKQVVSVINLDSNGCTTEGIDSYIRRMKLYSEPEDIFNVSNLGTLFKFWKMWKIALREIVIELKSDRVLLLMLVIIGGKLNWVKKAHLDAVSNLGLGEWISVNCCKFQLYAAAAADIILPQIVFASEVDLLKTEVIVQITVCGPGVRCFQSGSDMEYGYLLKVAKKLCFKGVGLRCRIFNLSSFTNNTLETRNSFNLGSALKLAHLLLLNIHASPSKGDSNVVKFSAATGVISQALKRYFLLTSGIKIAVPVCLYGDKPFILAAHTIWIQACIEKIFEMAEYWISDGFLVLQSVCLIMLSVHALAMGALKLTWKGKKVAIV